MPRWLKITGIGCGGLAMLFVVFMLGIAIGSVSTGDSTDSGEPPTLQGGSSQAGELPVPAPTTTEEAGREPLTLSGTGSQVTEPIEFSAGLAVFEASYQGESNFIVELIDEEGNRVEGIVNEIGSTEASRGIRIPEDGIYRLNIDSDGAWTIEVS